MSEPTSFDNHGQLFEHYVRFLESDELPFYRRESNFHYYAWYTTATTTFLCSVASVAAASFVGVKEFEVYGKYLLIALPAIGTLASGILNLYKFREKEALREEGRIELEDIILSAKSLLISSKGNEDSSKQAFHTIRERFKSLSLAQHRRDITLRSDDVDKAGGKPGPG